MRKVALTGASGFVGGYVLTELTKFPVDIVAVTRNTSRLADWADRVEVVAMDIADSDVNCYEKLGCPDVLIHLAWDGLPNYMSLHHFEIELPCQYRFLRNLLEGGLPSLTVTGTCFEYGMQSGALSEDMVMLPENPYGYAKHALFRQLSLLQQQHNFNLTWLRLFYMYGDNQPKTAIYSQLKSSIERGDDIFNMSGGEQLRDFLSVSRVAEIIATLALKGENPGAVNVCSGKPISIRSLVEGWQAEHGWSIHLNLGHYPYPDHEPMAFWGDDQRLNHILES
jgi:dTDP-6-deoxy-L-talose 4-dehydrogenase (NAD+)